MIISQELKYVFINVPKTASRSIASMLMKEFYGKRSGGGWLKDKHTHDHVVPEEYLEYFVFGTVRNPYSRAVSGWKMYQEVCSKNDVAKPTFCEYTKMISDKSLQFHHAMLKPCAFFESHRNFDQTLRFETLQKDFDSLPFNHNRPTLNKIGKTEHDHWKSYHTPYTERLLYRSWEEDFHKYEYSRLRLISYI